MDANELTTITDWKTLKDYSDQFEMHQTKQNLLKVDKVARLMNVIEDEIETRVTSCPDAISGKDLVAYYSAASNTIAKSKREITEVLSPERLQPKITINAQTNNILAISEESKQKVFDAVSILIAKMEEDADKENQIDLDMDEEEVDDVEETL